jgi:hypothetical protein
VSGALKQSPRKGLKMEEGRPEEKTKRGQMVKEEK